MENGTRPFASALRVCFGLGLGLLGLLLFGITSATASETPVGHGDIIQQDRPQPEASQASSGRQSQQSASSTKEQPSRHRQGNGNQSQQSRIEDARGSSAQGAGHGGRGIASRDGATSRAQQGKTADGAAAKATADLRAHRQETTRSLRTSATAIRQELDNTSREARRSAENLRQAQRAQAEEVRQEMAAATRKAQEGHQRFEEARQADLRELRTSMAAAQARHVPSGREDRPHKSTSTKTPAPGKTSQMQLEMESVAAEAKADLHEVTQEAHRSMGEGHESGSEPDEEAKSRIPHNTAHGTSGAAKQVRGSATRTEGASGLRGKQGEESADLGTTVETLVEAPSTLIRGSSRALTGSSEASALKAVTGVVRSAPAIVAEPPVKETLTSVTTVLDETVASVPIVDKVLPKQLLTRTTKPLAELVDGTVDAVVQPVTAPVARIAAPIVGATEPVLGTVDAVADTTDTAVQKAATGLLPTTGDTASRPQADTPRRPASISPASDPAPAQATSTVRHNSQPIAHHQKKAPSPGTPGVDTALDEPVVVSTAPQAFVHSSPTAGTTDGDHGSTTPKPWPAPVPAQTSGNAAAAGGGWQASAAALEHQVFRLHLPIESISAHGVDTRSPLDAASDPGSSPD